MTVVGPLWGDQLQRSQRSVVRVGVATWLEWRLGSERHSALGHLQSPVTTIQVGPPPFSGNGDSTTNKPLREAQIPRHLRVGGTDDGSSSFSHVFTPEAIVLALVVALGAAALQGSIGFGFAAVGVPLLTIIDPRFTPVPVLSTLRAWVGSWSVGYRVPSPVHGS